MNDKLKKIFWGLACVIVCALINIGIYVLMKDIVDGDMARIMAIAGSIWVDVDIIDYFKNKG